MDTSTTITRYVRFLIMSDTHGAELPVKYPECNVLIHCGDLTEDESPSSISEALQAFSNARAKIRLVVPGNHEISLNKTYYLAEGGDEANVGKAHALDGPEPNSVASRNGVTFLFTGTCRFTLASGATFRIYASPYTQSTDLQHFNTRRVKTTSMSSAKRLCERRMSVPSHRSSPIMSISS